MWERGEGYEEPLDREGNGACEVRWEGGGSMRDGQVGLAELQSQSACLRSTPPFVGSDVTVGTFNVSEAQISQTHADGHSTFTAHTQPSRQPTLSFARGGQGHASDIT